MASKNPFSLELPPAYQKPIRLIVYRNNRVYLINPDDTETYLPQYQNAWDQSLESEMKEHLDDHGIRVWVQVCLFMAPIIEPTIDIIEIEVKELNCIFIFRSVLGCTQWYLYELPGFESDVDLPGCFPMMIHAFYETQLAPVRSSVFNGLSALLAAMDKDRSCAKNSGGHFHYMVKIIINRAGWYSMHYICGDTMFRDVFIALCGNRRSGELMTLKLSDGECCDTITSDEAVSSKLVSELSWPGVGEKLTWFPKPDWLIPMAD